MEGIAHWRKKVYRWEKEKKRLFPSRVRGQTVTEGGINQRGVPAPP